MTFKSGFEGRKIVYAAAQTGADFDTDWQAVGTTVTADRPLDIEFIPRDAEHDVPTNHRVLVSFPEPINPSGMDASSVQLFGDGSTSVAAAAVVSDDGFFVSLRPRGGPRSGLRLPGGSQWLEIPVRHGRSE